MYKDKAKQKQANKEAKARFKAKQAKNNAPESTTIDKRQPEGIPTGYSQSGIPEGIPVKSKQGIPSLTAEQLYSGIYGYPQDGWKDSAEYKELMRRLHAFTIERLQAKGYFIPCWKFKAEQQVSQTGTTL